MNSLKKWRLEYASSGRRYAVAVSLEGASYAVARGHFSRLEEAEAFAFRMLRSLSVRADLRWQSLEIGVVDCLAPEDEDPLTLLVILPSSRASASVIGGFVRLRTDLPDRQAAAEAQAEAERKERRARREAAVAAIPRIRRRAARSGSSAFACPSEPSSTRS
jgi:hypothetical protein